MKIINKKYNISCNLDKNIVLLSDIHYYSKKDLLRLNKVLDNIKNIHPDYICISGDFIDNANVVNFDLFIEWLTKLSLVAPIMMVLGNHEYYNEKGIYKLNDKYIETLKTIKNIYFLDNNNKRIDNINFCGLTLPIEYYEKEKQEDFKKYVKNIKSVKNCYNILLCHSPINISKDEIIKNVSADLVLCGHMHGGLVPRILRPLFKTKGLISPQKTLFPNNAYGNIKVQNKNIIITSGIKVLSESHFKLLTNVFSSEIVEIKLESKNLKKVKTKK